MSWSYLLLVRIEGPAIAFNPQNFVTGDRALASCLAGGDLDGYVICVLWTALWFIRVLQGYLRHLLCQSGSSPHHPGDPAPLSESNVWRLNDDEPDATVDDICKFIVEYINSDVMVRSYQAFIFSPDGHTFANHRAC